MKIYFAAHATTKDNEEKIASGWKDVELSELGVRQGKELGETFENIKFDLICTSDLKRALDTAEVAFGNKHKIISDVRLREVNYGDFNGKSSEIVEKMKKDHISVPFPNGESYEQAIKRTQDFYREMMEEYPEKTILVIGHRVTQFGLDIMSGKSIEELLSVPFKWQPYWEYEF